MTGTNNVTEYNNMTFLRLAACMFVWYKLFKYNLSWLIKQENNLLFVHRYRGVRLSLQDRLVCIA